MLKLRRVDVLVFIVVTLVLGGVAWGIGWTAHGLFDRLNAATMETVEPTAVPPTAETRPTASPAAPPSATPTQPPESRPAPAPATSTPAPTAEHDVKVMVVKANDRGAYDVVRRACELSRNYVLSLDDEIVQETWQLNGFTGERPPIFEGQEIQVPVHLCP